MYEGAPITTNYFHKQIYEFGNSVKLNHSSMNNLLKLIKNALPVENKLMKSYKNIISLFKKSTSFNETLRCTTCLEIIKQNNSCSMFCEKNGQQRQTDNYIEHVYIHSLDKQLIDIIRRNKHLITTYPQLADKLLQCDVTTGLVYQEKKKNLQKISNDIHMITLMLYIDGTPIVRWTKKHTWLVMASIAEIPPPLRENKYNMLLLSVWYVNFIYLCIN